jgi:imidazolonepropionase-like amidohydrolase
MGSHRFHAIAAFFLIAHCVLAADQPQPVLIEAGRLLDVRTGIYLDHPGILTEGDRIKEIGDFANVRDHAPKDAVAIDLRTATVLPGLIDCHAHLLAAMEFRHLSDALTIVLTQMSPSTRALLGARNAREDLEAGVTTVRIVGHSGINGDAALRDAINAGWIPGPRILAATRKLAPPGGQDLPLHSTVASQVTDQEFRIIAGTDDARRAVREALHEGADVIKVVIGDKPPRLGTDEVRAIADEAHRSKIKVAVHASTAEAIDIAIQAGVDSIEHGEEASDQQLTQMRDKSIFLGATEWTRPAVLGPYDKIFKLTPEDQADFDAYFKNYSEKCIRRMQSARRLGVKIAAGSDMWFQYPDKTRGQATVFVLTTGLQSEGMPAIEIIRSLTVRAAELLGWQDRVGSIEPKHFADLIAVNGDPLTDISELQRVKFVMKGSLVVKNELRSAAVPSK